VVRRCIGTSNARKLGGVARITKSQNTLKRA